jgi:hypothetical protein
MATKVKIKDGQAGQVMPVMQLVQAQILTKEEAREILIDEATP